MMVPAQVKQAVPRVARQSVPKMKKSLPSASPLVPGPKVIVPAPVQQAVPRVAQQLVLRVQNALPSTLLLVLTEAKSRQNNEFGWSNVKKQGDTLTKSLKEQRALKLFVARLWLTTRPIRIPNSNRFGFLFPNVDNNNLMRSTTGQSTKTVQFHKCKQAGERAQARVKRVIDEKKTAARRLQQLKMEDIALKTAKVEVRKTTRAEPTLNQSMRQRLLEIERNKDAKKRSENNCLL